MSKSKVHSFTSLCTLQKISNYFFKIFTFKSPDGRLLAAASQEGIIYIQDMETLQLKYTIEGEAGVGLLNDIMVSTAKIFKITYANLIYPHDIPCFNNHVYLVSFHARTQSYRVYLYESFENCY